MRRFMCRGVAFLSVLLMVGCRVDQQDSSPTAIPTSVSQSTTESPGAEQTQTVESVPGLLTLDWEILGARGVSWSHDGKRIAVASSQALNIYDATTYDHLTKLEVWGSISSPDVLWSPDDRYIAYGLGNGNIPIRNVDTGEELFVLPGKGYFTDGMAWSRDGRWFAAGHDGQGVTLWDLQTGAAPIKVHVGKSHLTFSPDGERLAGISWNAWQANIR